MPNEQNTALQITDAEIVEVERKIMLMPMDLDPDEDEITSSELCKLIARIRSQEATIRTLKGTK